jgi:hypothetical protein
MIGLSMGQCGTGARRLKIRAEKRMRVGFCQGGRVGGHEPTTRLPPCCEQEFRSWVRKRRTGLREHASFNLRGRRTLQELEAENGCWSKPTQRLARQIGISDMAVAKRRHKLGVLVPKRSYRSLRIALSSNLAGARSAEPLGQ